MDDSTAIGRRIYDLRVEKDIQQGELAHAVSIHQSVLNRIEKGTRPIRDTELRDIALFLEVSSDYLLGIQGTIVSYNSPWNPVIPAQSSQNSTVYLKSSSKSPHLDFVPSSHEIELITKLRQLDQRGYRAVEDTLNREFTYVMPE